MSRFDEIDRVIDEGLAAAPAYREPNFGPPGADDVEGCWRCATSPSETSVGLCESCLAVLRDEKTTADEPDGSWRFERLAVDLAALGPEAVARYDAVVEARALQYRIELAFARRLLLTGFVTSEQVRADLGFDAVESVSERVEELLVHAASCPVCQAEREDRVVAMRTYWSGFESGDDEDA